MKNKTDTASLKIVEQAVYYYSLGTLIYINENNLGRDTHYVAETTKGKYFIKTLDVTNENVRVDDEIKACKLLRARGMTALPEYVKRKDGGYVTEIDAQTFFHVQRFIEGDTWRKNQAPDWLLFAGAAFISEVHTNLAQIDLKQRGAIQRINDPYASLKELDDIEKSLVNLRDSEYKILLMQDIALRRDILQKQEYIEVDKLTFVNGHSDYTVTQIITSEKNLVGVIDFSEVSNIPAIWEIMRFYLNSAIEIKKMQFDEKRFIKFLNRYTDKFKLNEYDKNMLIDFNLYYFCQALSVYRKLLSSGFSTHFIDRIISRNNIIQLLKTINWN